ncbi:MAG: DUF115 domain-containing protein [Spirochaetia bacterium]|nr:DUF115 domain-containing protein [Spirochaetia bacterium]
MSLAGDTISALARFPGVADFLRDGQPPALLPDVSPVVEASRKGLPTLRLGSSWAHSRYDPEAESRKIGEEALASGAELVVLVGMGLGYTAEAILAQGAAVLVLEPDPGVLAASLGARDLAGLIRHERFHVLAGQDISGLSAVVEGMDPRSLAYLVNPAYRAAFPEFCSRAQTALERFKEKDSVNEATLRRFGRRWVRNLAANYKRIARLPGVSSLFGATEGFPALVLAAGPSLDDVAPELPRLHERMLIVCVDTALRSCLRAGVEPDIVVVVDPQYWNARHIDRCSSPSSILVTEAAVWPSVFRLDARATVLCSSLYPLGRWFEGRSGTPKGTLGAGGSVATSAWDLARLMGCAPIYMAGLDLGFPRGRTHARASLFEQRMLGAGSRLEPASTALFAAMRGGQPFQAKANDGTTLVSDRRLSLYSWWFASRVARHPATRSQTFSRGGLAIPGLTLADPEDALSLAPIRGQIDAALSAALAATEGRPAGQDPDGVMSALLDALVDIERLADHGLALATKAANAPGSELDGLLDRLSELDAQILANSARDIVGFLFPSVRDVVQGRSRTFVESLEKSMRLYGEIKASAEWHRVLLAASRISV